VTIAVATAGLPAARDVSATWQAFMGIPADSDGYRGLLRDVSDFARAPADEAWVYRCVALKASFAAAVPLRVLVRDGHVLTPAEDTTDEAARELQGLLDDANPDEMNGPDLVAWTIAARAVWGEAFWRKVRGRLGGRPRELYWRRAPDVLPVRGQRWIDNYEYRPAGRLVETWLPRDVVPFRTINLADPVRGLSPLSAVRTEMATNRGAVEWTAATLANHGIPETVFTIPKDADFSAQDRSLVQRVLRALRGPKNRGRSAILPKGLEPKVLSLNPRDAEWLAARKVSRMTICAVQGVPLVLAGDDERTTVYANLRDAERVFARHMISELDWLAASINGWLVPDFDPAPAGRRRIVVAFDTSGIEALAAPIEDRKRVALAEVERAVRSRDEYRAEFRIGPPLPDQVAQFAVVSNLLPLALDRAPAAPHVDVVAGDESPVRHLYRTPEVRAWLAGTGSLGDVAALLGVEPSEALVTGLGRRYSAAQLLAGVPDEDFAPLRRTPP